MRTIETTLYTFDELNETAKVAALEKLHDLNTDHDWWCFVYDDAKCVGIEIIGFDIDRGNYCDGKFIDDAISCADAIIKEHGSYSPTYKLAKQFQTDRDKIIDDAPRDEDGEFRDEAEVDDNLDDIENEFLVDIKEEYLGLLRLEYEYKTSDEAITETIEANEYEFTANGEMH